MVIWGNRKGVVGSTQKMGYGGRVSWRLGRKEESNGTGPK